MTKDITRWMPALAVLLGLVTYALGERPPSVVQAVPVPPTALHGEVTVGGGPAPAGTIIEAQIGGVNFAFAPDEPDNIPRTASDGTYGKVRAFQVLADDSETPQKEGGVKGDTIRFFLGNEHGISTEVANTAVFEIGSIIPLDLAISALPVAPPPPPPPPGGGVEAHCPPQRRSLRRRRLPLWYRRLCRQQTYLMVVRLWVQAWLLRL